MTKKFRLLAVGLALCLLLLPGCNKDKGENEDDFPVLMSNATVSEPPQRVVSLSPSLTELSQDLGYAQALVGISDSCALPEGKEEDFPRCGTAQTPDMEQIQSLNAQYVLVSSNMADGQRTQLQQLGVDVIVIEPASTLEELQQLYETLGTFYAGNVTGKAQGKQVYDQQMASLQEVADTISSAGKEPLVALYAPRPASTVATGETLEQVFMEKLGLSNAAASATGWFVDPEQAQALVPQVVFYGEGFTPEQVQQAYPQAGEDLLVIQADTDAIARQGSGMFQEWIRLAKAAYPDLFPQDAQGEAASQGE